MRPGCLVAAALVALGALLAVLASLGLMRGDGSIDIGRVDDYAPGSVVYRSTDGVFVVRLLDGRILALSDLDPHNPGGRASCRVTFRPDLAQEGKPGKFFDRCTGSRYDLAGHSLSSDGRDLSQLPVWEDEDGRLSVERPAHVSD